MRHSVVAVGCLAIAMTLAAAADGVRAASPGPATLSPPDAGAAAVIARYQARIPQLMAEQGIPGLSIAVVDGDHVLWAQGFGTTDRHAGTPVTTDTIFSVQSMSKVFTATAVMEAVGKGLLDLDEPITTYLPGFTVHSAFEAHPEQKITLRMLLSHTAGFTHEAPVGNNDDGDASDWDAHIQSISDTWLRFPVGTGYAYSNLGVDLAGHILEQAWGEPFAAVMRDALLGPLGMDHSTFDVDQIHVSADRAVGSTDFGDAFLVDVPMTAAGGLYASAADLARFLELQLGDGTIDGQTLVDPALIEEQRTVPPPRAGALMGYALGVERTHWRAGRYLDLFTHNGGGWGFLSDLWWLPQLQLGIAVLTNASSHQLQGDLALSILRDFVSEPGSIYQQRLISEPAQNDVVDVSDAYLPPPDMAGLVAGAAMPPTGDEATRWTGYEGVFRIPEWGVIDPTRPPDRFLVDAGAPVFETEENGTLARHPLVEVAPGLFLADNGETLDLRGEQPTWRSLAMVRISGGPGLLGWVLLAASSVVALGWLIGGALGIVRRRRGAGSDSSATRRLGVVGSIVATCAALLVLMSAGLIAVIPGLVDSGFLGWLELPIVLRLALHVPIALAAACVSLVSLIAVAMARGRWSPSTEPRLAAITVAVSGVAIQLAAWNLVGWGLT